MSVKYVTIYLKSNNNIVDCHSYMSENIKDIEKWLVNFISQDEVKNSIKLLEEQCEIPNQFPNLLLFIEYVNKTRKMTTIDSFMKKSR